LTNAISLLIVTNPRILFYNKPIQMKYFLTISLSFIICMLTAQSGTTLDEYRYLSKGYAYQLEMGLDPTKNGYEIHNNYTAQNGTSIIGLYLTSTDIPKGLLFVTTDARGKSYYQALPNPQSAPNVLALYQQDQAKHLPKVVKDKIATAKNHYLFTNLKRGKATSPIGNNSVPIISDANFSKNLPSEKPTTYEAFPDVKNEQFTAKGGTPIISQKMAPDDKIAILSEKTITGQINNELSMRTVLVLPYVQNTTAAKGRIMIKFCANAEGAVTYAKFTQRGSTTLNSQLKALALAAVRKMRFGPTSTVEDCGTVGFDF